MRVTPLEIALTCIKYYGLQGGYEYCVKTGKHSKQYRDAAEIIQRRIDANQSHDGQDREQQNER